MLRSKFYRVTKYNADKIIDKQIDVAAQRYGNINVTILYPTQVEPMLIVIPIPIFPVLCLSENYYNGQIFWLLLDNYWCCYAAFMH